MTNPRPAAPLDAQLQIYRIHSCDDAAAVVVARCVHGPVRLHARFHRIRDTPAPIDLELTQILVYGRPVEALYPVHTALVTLQGTGMHHLEPETNDPALRRPVIQGTNLPS